MTDTTAAFYRARPLDRRPATRRDGRRLARGGATGLGAVAATGVLITSVTLAGAWLLNTYLSSNSQIHSSVSLGPRSLTLAGPYRVVANATDAATPDASFETRWARALVPASASAIAMPLLAQPLVAVAENVPMPLSRPIIPTQVEQSPDVTPVAELVPEPATDVPLPRPYPEKREPALAPVPPTPQLAVASQVPAPAPERRLPQAPNRLAALPGADSRTAVYDIAAHTVYLPTGEKLEAHSGLGDKLDDPRFVKVRMRGPTPPNVYDLTLREELFHGVRAIRLNPVDDDKMFGRDGMLAHTYMLGDNGQSNGCVSFKDYSKFLHAFLKGEVDRLVVVAHLDKTPVQTARRAHRDRYALNTD